MPVTGGALARLRAVRGYETSFRIVGAGWFVMLALVAFRSVVIRCQTMDFGDFSQNGWPGLLSSACVLLFYLMLGWLILHRSPPASRTAGVLPSVTAFFGTYLPWSIILFPPGTPSAGQEIVSGGLELIGVGLMVVVICHLGRCFSIVPQGRALVRTGPYAVVRHPLYLVEEVALLGTLLQYYSALTLALFLVHGTLQVGRIFFEEDLLRDTFADYGAYEKSTARLIPFVW
jgi:protein-S-isoprenylcysteine O-methyltransferase Ste14